MLREPLYSVFIVLLGLGLGYALLVGGVTAQSEFLRTHVVPPENVPIEDWIVEYRRAQFTYVIYPFLGLSALWIIAAAVHDSRAGALRWLWFTLWAVSAGVALLGGIFGLPETSGTLVLPSTLTVILAIIAFWVATAPFSWTTHKFAPALSQPIRNGARY